jgi:hypothetical protein
MTPRREGLAAGVLALGYALAAALYWALLNVPESNGLALALSASLVPLIVGTSAVATAGAVMIASGATTDLRHRMRAAIGGFVAGLAIVATLWWATGRADGWWSAHRGEVDALFLRHGGMTRTRWLHQTVFWVTFLVRWALGMSVLAALVVAGASGGRHPFRRGLRSSVHVAALSTTMVAVVIVTGGLWRLAWWRPRSLPSTWIEPAFVTLKLTVLYALVVGLAACVLGVHRRTAGSASRSD